LIDIASFYSPKVAWSFTSVHYKDVETGHYGLLISGVV